jgi:excisionase family DNA binding protein
MDENPALTPRQVAARTGLRLSSIYKKIHLREIAFFKPGGPRGPVRFLESDVQAFIASRRVPSYDEAAKARRQAGKPERPGQAKGLDFESAAALVAGALQSPEDLEIVKALLEAHRQLGQERFGELVERVLVSLPQERHEEARRRLAAAEEALAKVLMVMAPAEAAHG